MGPDMASLSDRVARLELENRRLRMIGLAGSVLVASIVLVGANKGPRTIEAEKIVLLDSHGRARLTISTPSFAGATIDGSPDDPTVWLTDEKGADRAMLRTDGLFFANGKSRPTVTLSSRVKIS